MSTREKAFKKKVSAILAFSMLFALLFANTVLAEETAETPDTSIVESVVVNTTVTIAGQYPETMEVTVTDASALEGLTAEDFTLAGQATGWMTPLHDFTATISDISVNENVLTLAITDFADKFFYVDNFTVTCTKNDNLSFTDEKVAEITTPIADEFEQIQAENGLTYNLYTPAETEAQPLVIAFHGFLDDDNLLQNRLATAWADPENQAERPCYVMAPVMGGYAYYNGASRDATYVKVYEEVQKMIDEGKVDPNQIYVVGKSFGGRAVYEFLAKYPELPAGAIAMCGAMESFFSDEIAFENLVDIPLWIAHATTDSTVNVEDSRNVYNTLVELGSTVVHYTEYSDEEMVAAGVTTAMGNHSMEAVVLEDEAYMEWLFAQPEPVELPFTDVADTNWFYPYVEFVYANGLMVGTSDTNFRPNDVLTRAQFATILYRMEGESETEYADVFVDVSAGQWYTEAVVWANAKEIVLGYGNGKFGPNDTLAREQLVLMLYSYAEMKGYDVSNGVDFTAYADSAEVHEWAETAMKWAVGNEIVKGQDETTLNPLGDTTRAEGATMIMRFVELYK